VRALCSIGEAERASGLLRAETDVVYTRDRHSVITARAIVSEAKGEVNQALRLYEDTAERWHQHGFVLEEGHALLGVDAARYRWEEPRTPPRDCMRQEMSLSNLEQPR
jgi:hypothetical protein